MPDRSEHLSRGDCQAGRAWVGREHGGHADSVAIHPWPAVPEEHRRRTRLIEERLDKNNRTPEESTARARSARVRSRPVCADMPGVYTPSMALHPWPEILDDHRWVIESLEERFENPDETSEELSARACELRSLAAASELDGQRDALLALADRYEAAAARRIAPAAPTS
jgi:hypothetical protein